MRPLLQIGESASVALAAVRGQRVLTALRLAAQWVWSCPKLGAVRSTWPAARAQRIRGWVHNALTELRLKTTPLATDATPIDEVVLCDEVRAGV